MPTNEDDLSWQEVQKGNAHFRRKQLGAADGAEQLGCSLYELPPGGASFPYHYHTGNEEALYVLSGTGTLRLDGEEHAIEAGDFAALPSSAPRIRNDGDEPVRFLMVSTMNDPDVMVYPDSEKVGFVAGAAPGGDKDERTEEAFFRFADQVDYWDGERDASCGED
ncbi:cupin [Halobacteriales archaeon QS_1_68_20]|nr:MAG: cupin [Halobacteriales archaeon QS_1_68_20]